MASEEYWGEGENHCRLSYSLSFNFYIEGMLCDGNSPGVEVRGRIIAVLLHLHYAGGGASDVAAFPFLHVPMYLPISFLGCGGTDRSGPALSFLLSDVFYYCIAGRRPLLTGTLMMRDDDVSRMGRN